MRNTPATRPRTRTHARARERERTRTHAHACAHTHVHARIHSLFTPHYGRHSVTRFLTLDTSPGTIDENAITSLSFVAQLTKHIRINPVSSRRVVMSFESVEMTDDPAPRLSLSLPLFLSSISSPLPPPTRPHILMIASSSNLPTLAHTCPHFPTPTDPSSARNRARMRTVMMITGTMTWANWTRCR